MVTLYEEQGEVFPRRKETSSHDKLRREMLSCFLLRFPREACYDQERGQSTVDGRQLGRSQSYGGNSLQWNEFKFVFKSYSEVTSTSDRNATEPRLIPIECDWHKGKNKEQEERGNKNPISGLSSNCRKWCHNDASGWHRKEK